MQHCVIIYPDGFDVQKEVRIFFYSIDEKKSYMKREYAFTKKEYDKYCISGSKREELKDEFLKKRVLFAKQNDYGPKPSNKKVWVKMPKMTNNRIA